MKDKGFLPAAAEISGPEPAPGEGRNSVPLARWFGPLELFQMGVYGSEKPKYAALEFQRGAADATALMASITVPLEVARKIELFGLYDIVLVPRSSESGSAATVAERTASPSGLDAAGKESAVRLWNEDGTSAVATGANLPTSEAGNG